MVASIWHNGSPFLALCFQQWFNQICFDLRSRCRSVTNQTHPRPVMELSEWFVHFEIVNSSTAAIKKTVLQQVTSVLDPLGFLSSIIMSAKVLLQEIGRSGSHWGMIRFRKIFYPFGIPLDLKSITSIQIPRCLRLNEFQSDTSFMSLRMLSNLVSELASIYEQNTHPEISFFIFLWLNLEFPPCGNYLCASDSRCKEQFLAFIFALPSSLSLVWSYPKLSTGATLKQYCNGFIQHHAYTMPLDLSSKWDLGEQQCVAMEAHSRWHKSFRWLFKRNSRNSSHTTSQMVPRSWFFSICHNVHGQLEA